MRSIFLCQLLLLLVSGSTFASPIPDPGSSGISFEKREQQLDAAVHQARNANNGNNNNNKRVPGNGRRELEHPIRRDCGDNGTYNDANEQGESEWYGRRELARRDDGWDGTGANCNVEPSQRENEVPASDDTYNDAEEQNENNWY